MATESTPPTIATPLDITGEGGQSEGQAVNTTISANTQLLDDISSLGKGNQATRMVGWNAVPSGFEPLKRSVGNKKC